MKNEENQTKAVLMLRQLHSPALFQMMDTANKPIYENYGVDGSGYYTDNGRSAIIYVKAAKPFVLEALREYVSTDRNIQYASILIKALS